jgi:hypothetical protein
MPLIYSNSADGEVQFQEGPGGGGFSAARDAGTGTVINASQAENNSFTAVFRFGSRGGTPPYRIHRSFAFFDTSGVTGTVTSAQFEIVGFDGNSLNGSMIAVKSTAFGGDGGTALKTIDYDAITGFTTGASLEGNATKYSTQFVASDGWSSTGVNVLTGTSDLRTDMQNNNVVIVCFMDYTNDYLNVDPSSTTSLKLGGRYNEASSAGQRLRINYTEVAAGYGNNVNRVASANIEEINTVASANIEEINRV